MFFNQPPTPLDLNFRVGPFPVRVSPWHFLGLAFFGYPYFRHPILGPFALALFILAGFLSILVHELGHASAGRYFGKPSRIVLIAFGGYASFYNGNPRSGWRSLLMVLAGPAAGFTFALLLYVSNQSVGWARPGGHPAVWFLYLISLTINIVWSVFNLLPIWPLDGGRALRELLYLFGMRQPDVPTHYAGLVGAAALSAVGIFAALNPRHPLLDSIPYQPGLYGVIFFGLLAYANWKELQQHQGYRGYDDDERWKGY